MAKVISLWHLRVEIQNPSIMGRRSVVIVLSGADEASTLQFLAPYTGAKSSCSGPQIVWFAEAL
jgi:F0F1-type ATP synthase alpha subunit